MTIPRLASLPQSRSRVRAVFLDVYGRVPDSEEEKQTEAFSIHGVISSNRRVRGPRLRGLVGRVPSRGVTSDVEHRCPLGQAEAVRDLLWALMTSAEFLTMP